jgi:hypothetical protein
MVVLLTLITSVVSVVTFGLLEPTRVQGQSPADLRLPTEESLAAAIGETVVDGPREAPIVDGDELIDGVLAVADSLPADEWRIDALAEALDYDPEAAFHFVRDRIRFEPYRGVLRGPMGALAARAGNAYDRALLLQALLDEMFVTSRLAFGELEVPTADAIARRTTSPPSLPLPAGQEVALGNLDGEALATRARRDYARLRDALGSRWAPEAGAAIAWEDLAAESRDHAWVQVLRGVEWIDLDPTLPTAEPGDVLVAAPAAVGDVAPEARQAVRLQVVAEHRDGETLTERTVLDERFDAAAAARSALFLYFQPEVSGIGGAILEVMGAAQSFMPALMVDGEVIAGDGFAVEGSGDPFSGGPGLLDDDGFFDGETVGPELVSLRLVVSSEAPGAEPIVAERWLLDRAPVLAREAGTVGTGELAPLATDEGGPVALQGMHHVMVSVGGSSLLAHAIERGLALDFAMRLGLAEDETTTYPLGDLLYPVAIADEALVVASERAIIPSLDDRPGLHAYVAHPRVFISSMAASPTAADEAILELDLLLDGVRVAADEGTDPADVARRRLWYGVLQSALENEHGARRARPFSPGTEGAVSASLASSGPLIVLGAEDEGALPDDAPAALRQALRDGQLAVLPEVGAIEAWWAVSPTSGLVRAMVRPALGAHKVPIKGGQYGAGQKWRPPSGPKYANKPLQPSSFGGQKTWLPNGGYEQNGKYYPPERPAPPPAGRPTCRGGTEYVVILGCVSLPVAWAIRWGFRAAVTMAVLYAIYALAF